MGHDMRTIGQQYTHRFRNLRTKEMEEKLCEEIVQRLTRDEYGHNSKYSRKLVVTLHAPDTITIKPVGFRTDALVVTANIGEVYKTLLARKHMTAALAKAREKKEKNKEVRARKARYAKERRFREQCKRDNANVS
jgi:hypothetical protein